MQTMRMVLVLALAGVLGGCGFQLRGQAQLPFKTLYVNVPPTSPFGTQLKRAITGGSQTRVIDQGKDAEAILTIVNELREKQILSLGGGGRVREFQLRYRVVFRLNDPTGTREYIGPSEILDRKSTRLNSSHT